MMRHSLFLLVMGMAAGIEPATSLCIISHPAYDAIVRNKRNVAQQILPPVFVFKTRFPPRLDRHVGSAGDMAATYIPGVQYQYCTRYHIDILHTVVVFSH